MRWIHTSGIVLVLFRVFSGLLGSGSWKLETLSLLRDVGSEPQWKIIEAQCADIFSYLQFFVCLAEYQFLCLLRFMFSSASNNRRVRYFLLMLCFGWKIFERVTLCCKDIKDNYYCCCNKTFSISVLTLFSCLGWKTDFFLRRKKMEKCFNNCSFSHYKWNHLRNTWRAMNDFQLRLAAVDWLSYKCGSCLRCRIVIVQWTNRKQWKYAGSGAKT